MKLQRKGPGRLSNCSEKGRDGYETAAKRAGTAVQLQQRAGTAMKLQRKGPGRLWNCSEKCRDAYRLAAKRARGGCDKELRHCSGKV